LDHGTGAQIPDAERLAIRPHTNLGDEALREQPRRRPGRARVVTGVDAGIDGRLGFFRGRRRRDGGLGLVLLLAAERAERGEREREADEGARAKKGPHRDSASGWDFTVGAHRQLLGARS
jgi:hypothetical protein